jgi:hypothetical protein
MQGWTRFVLFLRRFQMFADVNNRTSSNLASRMPRRKNREITDASFLHNTLMQLILTPTKMISPLKTPGHTMVLFLQHGRNSSQGGRRFLII